MTGEAYAPGPWKTGDSTLRRVWSQGDGWAILETVVSDVRDNTRPYDQTNQTTFLASKAPELAQALFALVSYAIPRASPGNQLSDQAIQLAFSVFRDIMSGLNRESKDQLYRETVLRLGIREDTIPDLERPPEQEPEYVPPDEEDETPRIRSSRQRVVLRRQRRREI